MNDSTGLAKWLISLRKPRPTPQKIQLQLEYRHTDTSLFHKPVLFLEVKNMPVRKTPSGKYKWGSSGKEYSTKEAAERQGRAIKASQGKKKKPSKSIRRIKVWKNVEAN